MPLEHGGGLIQMAVGHLQNLKQAEARWHAYEQRKVATWAQPTSAPRTPQYWQGSPRQDYKDMSKDDLKELAEERGIKEDGVGWPTCCPPQGNKDDIIKALRLDDRRRGR